MRATVSAGGLIGSTSYHQHQHGARQVRSGQVRSGQVWCLSGRLLWWSLHRGGSRKNQRVWRNCTHIAATARSIKRPCHCPCPSTMVKQKHWQRTHVREHYLLASIYFTWLDYAPSCGESIVQSCEYIGQQQSLLVVARRIRKNALSIMPSIHYYAFCNVSAYPDRPRPPSLHHNIRPACLPTYQSILFICLNACMYVFKLHEFDDSHRCVVAAAWHVLLLHPTIPTLSLPVPRRSRVEQRMH